ncbi:MAG: PAS domain-containing protein [Actinomycetota bacterium]|nr:PAS domain-containing protein [Actinomycetota bacterium]
MDNALDMISVCSVENTFLYISPSVERVLGYRPEELIGATVSDFVHPDDLAEYGQRIIEEIQTASGPFGPIEARYRHKDGSWRHLETTMNVLVDDPDVGVSSASVGT